MTPGMHPPRRATRALWVHAALLAVAGASSVYVWTRDTKAVAAAAADVVVWKGRPDEVQRVVFESSAGSVSLESRVDAQGRWFYGLGRLPPPPHVDGGAPAPPPKRPVFVSLAAAQKIAQALAPFKAVRQIGRIDGARAGEFGFKEPSPTLVVSVAGAEHHLTLGGPTPSGAERYVRDDSSGLVYAAGADFVRELEAGEATLIERDVHDFQDADLVSARVVARGKAREVLRRGPASKRIWSDPGSPEQADETVSNWLSKVDRLKPTEYAEGVPGALEPIVRIEYRVKGVEGSPFLELAKVPGLAGKPDYFIRSERTRLWAKVIATWAEQVEQDAGSVVK